MSFKVSTQVIISRARADVAGFAMDPQNDPIWIGGITKASVLTAPPFGKGTQVERVAYFLGKRIAYVNEVVEYDPDGLLVMQSVKGPLPMMVRYEFEEEAGGTLARIKIEGEAGGFYRLAGPVLTRMIKRSVTNDLETLKDLLEAEEDAAAGEAPAS